MEKLARRCALLTVALVVLSGCLTVDAALKADGTGTMTVAYEVPPGVTIDALRKFFEGPHVKVESAQLKNQTAVLKLAFADVTKLNTSPFFAALTTTLTGDAGTKTLVAKLPIPRPPKKDQTPKATPGKADQKAAPTKAAEQKAKPGQTPEQKQKPATGGETATAKKAEKKPDFDIRVSLTLPGAVVETNATERRDAQVHWTIHLQDLEGKPEAVMSVTFKVPAKKGKS